MKIETRRLQFCLPKDLPRHWNHDCPIKTHLLNAIAILAPAFERLAISSVIPYKNAALPSPLAEDLQGFIGQESAHGSEFIRYNQILKLQGYDTKKLEKANLKQFKWLSKKLSPKMHLSLTLAAEHLTAIISDLLLREPEWLAKAHPRCRALWRWHSIEEIEHKAVAFDLYHHIKGGYAARILGMWMVTNMLGFLLARNYWYLIKKDKLLFKLHFWKKCFQLCWGKKGFLRKLILPYLSYFNPHFHPWKHNNQALISKWKEYFQETEAGADKVHLLELS